MSKKANQIIDDAIRRANEQAKNLSPTVAYMKSGGLNGGRNTGAAFNLDTMMNAEHWNQVQAGIHIAVANALDIGRKSLNAYIEDEATPKAKDLDRVKEVVDILDGTRNANNLAKRAVRFDNLKSLAGMTSTPMKVKKVQAAPTMEEYNALVDAFRELWNRIFEIEIQRRTHGNTGG